MILIFILFAMILFLMRYRIVNTPNGIGKRGESRVISILSRLPSKEYKVIHNVIIKVNGRSPEIDHIVISLCGIFVIETKNYSGWIFGKENSKYWMTSIYGNRYKFLNPMFML